jgi:hypothetical protein
MNLNCIVTIGLAGVIAIAMVYYLFSVWNTD